MAVENKVIVTIYAMKNKGKELKCFAVDAKAFLAHDRWSKSPEVKKEDAKGANAPKKRS